MSHASVPLSTINTNTTNDSTVAWGNLRSYVALARPGLNANNRMTKSTDVTNPVSRAELSILSG